MASIEPRTNEDESTSYRVRWRKGGKREGKREGETFHDLPAAEDFAAAVTRAGEDWPWGYVPGIGWDAQAYALLTATEPATEPQHKAVTFREFAEQCVGLRAKASPNTKAGYRRDLSNHFYPVFGDADIGDEEAFSEATIGAWVVAMLDRPMAATTVINLHSLLYSILKTAVRQKLRSTNPAEYTELPLRDIGSDEDEMVFLTRGEFHALLNHVNEDARDMLTVMVNTGLRWSEITALQVRDVIDLLGPKPKIRVRRAWKRQPDSTFKEGPPKSRRSRRNVSVNKAIAEILIKLIAGKSQKDYLFTTTSTGVVVRHNLFYDTRWVPAVYKAIRCEGHRAEDGLKRVDSGRTLRKRHLVPCGCPGMLEKVPRIHDLRHSHASWLIADGVPLTAIQRRLGHQSIQTTSDRYGHLMPEVDDALVAGLESAWNETLPATLSASQALQ